jgi:hypothetical protein
VVVPTFIATPSQVQNQIAPAATRARMQLHLLLSESLTNSNYTAREKRLYKFSHLVMGCDHYNPHLLLCKKWVGHLRFGLVPFPHRKSVCVAVCANNVDVVRNCSAQAELILSCSFVLLLCSQTDEILKVLIFVAAVS